jgi:hypothetical protein
VESTAYLYIVRTQFILTDGFEFIRDGEEKKGAACNSCEHITSGCSNLRVTGSEKKRKLELKKVLYAARIRVNQFREQSESKIRLNFSNFASFVC